MDWLIILGVIVIIFGFVVFFGAPYLPSQRKYVRRAFENVYALGKNDVLVDVGSGDGLVLRIAAEYGAHAIGYEINPVLVALSKLLSVRQPLVRTHLANFWMISLPDDTTVVYAFGVKRDGEKMRALMQRETNRLKRPLRLLSHATPIEGMKPERTFDAYALYTFRPR